MKYRSTKNKHIVASLKEALLQGLAPDGGLYFPEPLPNFPHSHFKEFAEKPFNDMAFDVLKHFCLPELKEDALKNVIQTAFPFEPQLKKLHDHHYVLELFHGPTLAFKDFGASFLATTMSALLQNKECPTILVATSGDTGSAVAHAFYKKKGLRVVILYPKGKISDVQEKQFTTLGDNIHTLAVDGHFDDCQALVKQAFLDSELKGKFFLTSANSINIGRLLPQALYYAYAYGQLVKQNKRITFSVPSGNLGNLTSGVVLQRVFNLKASFISALNANDVFEKYLQSGAYHPQQSKMTIANAMDVGNPSNFERLNFSFNEELENFLNVISATHFDDKQTLELIQNCHDKYQYIIDPHTAIAYGGSLEAAKTESSRSVHVSLSTAHPAKFPDVIEKALGQKPEVPERLKACLNKKSFSIDCSKEFDSFKKTLSSLLEKSAI